MSSEPAYISDNGKRVPYIPKEITTHREAYAATLHVLFKHVADFHICIVKAFSKKYGIPEDDIMQTIQESDEFKNMAVDPVLNHSDSLGYLTPLELAAEPAAEPAKAEPAKTEPVEPAKAEPVVMKKIVKKKQPVVPVVPVEPVVPVVPVVSVTPNADNAKIIRKNPALKKQTHAQEPQQEPQQDIQAPQQEPQEPQCNDSERTDSERTDSERTDSVSYSSPDSLQISPTDATVIKKKIIRKKIAPEKQAQ
jgi:hypothetical protein